MSKTADTLPLWTREDAELERLLRGPVPRAETEPRMSQWERLWLAVAFTLAWPVALALWAWRWW